MVCTQYYRQFSSGHLILQLCLIHFSLNYANDRSRTGSPLQFSVAPMIPFLQLFPQDSEVGGGVISKSKVSKVWVQGGCSDLFYFRSNVSLYKGGREELT